MTLRRFVSSAVATIMVMDMLILALAMLPVNTSALTGDAPAAAAEAPQEAGFFGCLWACLKCVGTVGQSTKSCRKCAGCLGDDDPGTETATPK
jgi:hypothetical protein